MYSITRPAPEDCLCPPGRPGATPCPDINLEIRIESVINGSIPGTVIITYVVIDTNTNAVNNTLTYSWTSPSGHSFTQIGQHRIQITYNGSGGQIVLSVTATMPNRTGCDYSAVYTQPPCIDPVITFDVSLDCQANLITITACVNGNCNNDPNYIYQWYLPNAMNVTFLAPNVIRLTPTQILLDCLHEYLLFLFDARTGCRTRQLIRGNLCDAPLLDECCNHPILSSLCSLWLLCPPPNGCTVDIEVDGRDYFLCTQGLSGFVGYGDVVDVILLGGNHSIFRVLCNGEFHLRVCANTQDCLCPTDITDVIVRQPDRIGLGPGLENCAEWDLSTLPGSDRVVTIGTCAPCAPPYNCTQLPPQPPNTFLVEITYAQNGNFSPFPCSNLVGNNQIPSPVFIPFGPGTINLFNVSPVSQMWITQGSTLRVGVRLTNNAPVPTLNGQVASGFHLGNPLNPFWDIVITGNLLIRFDTNYIYTPSLPGTTISIDPC